MKSFLFMLLVGLVLVGCATIATKPPPTTEYGPVLAATVTPVPELSVEFNTGVVRARGPIEVKVGEEVDLRIEFKNTSKKDAELCVAVTLRPTDVAGNTHDINLRPLIPNFVRAGRNGEGWWQYKPSEPGSFDVIFGVWAACADKLEPNHAVNKTEWFTRYLVVKK